MKKFTLLAILTIISIGSFVACNNDDPYSPPSDVEKSFTTNFPDASNPTWIGYGFYSLALFDNEYGDYTNAYFNKNGLLLLTGVDIDNEEFPSAVTTAFNSSIYSSWTVTNTGKLSRYNMSTLYVYTIYSGDSTFMLYYDSDGTLEMQLKGGNLYNSLSNIPYEIVFSIKETYRGTYIVDCRYLVDGDLEVDILDIDAVKIVTFNSSLCWLYTYWQINSDALSTTVTDGIESAGYSDYDISKVLLKQFANDVYYYTITLTKSDSSSVTINIDSDGNLVTD